MAGYTGKKGYDKGNTAYQKLREDLKAENPGRLYIFRGEERYLLEDALSKLRAMIPEETKEFNHRRLEGRSLSMDDLADAVDALPVFAERTLTEVWDYDFGKMGEEARGELVRILSDIPDYATIVFISDTVEFKLDGRVKANISLKALFEDVEFTLQSDDALFKWLSKNFAAVGKRISRDASMRLIEMTGGLMTGLKTEVEKLAAYVTGNTVTVRDVEAVVTPTPDAAVWELTDALISRKSIAMEKLGELIMMDEAPHKILFSVSQKLKQLLTARICLDNKVNIKEYMKLADVRFEFQARALFEAARRTDTVRCAGFMEMAADTALRLNSTSGDDRALLTELAVRILA